MPAPLYGRIQEIIESARAGAARSVNTAQVVSNWLIGREIVEEDQGGRERAEYGRQLIENVSKRLVKEYGRGFAVRNLAAFREFYLEYPGLTSALSRNMDLTDERSQRMLPGILHSVSAKLWKPGRLHPDLSWTHYRKLLRVDKSAARAFYEIEAIRNKWSVRELERQINSFLYERLAKSKDQAGLMKLAVKGQEILRPEDVFKDPMVIEFLGIPESHKLVESKLEEGLIGNLQKFLLELGKGFAFVSRQERLTLDGDHFYIDLVFYHAVLKCFVLIDLKAGKLTHQDLGQMQFYVNYFDRERLSQGDNPSLGLVLCADKNDTVVRYTLGDARKKIFASRYKLHLPTEDELKSQLKRELLSLRREDKRDEI